MFQELLRKSKEDTKIISIRLCGGSDSFYCGYVVDFNENLMILQHFTKFGKHDGLMVERLENVESIDFDDDYTRAMAYIVENNVLLDLEENIRPAVNDSENWAYDLLNPHLGKDNLIVAIQIKGDCFYTGMIKDINEGHIQMNLLGKDGQDEGMSIYKVEDITSVRLNDLEDRRRLILFRWRHLKK